MDLGFSKIIYYLKLLEKKWNEDKFKKFVRSVLPKDVLSLTVCRANTHSRARHQYMLDYIVLDELKEQQPINSNTLVVKHEERDNTSDSNKGKEGEAKITHSLIETCVGLFRKCGGVTIMQWILMDNI